jgi:hypothetical protein
MTFDGSIVRMGALAKQSIVLGRANECANARTDEQSKARALTLSLTPHKPMARG